MSLRDGIPWNCNTGEQPRKLTVHGTPYIESLRSPKTAIPTQGAVSFLPLDRSHGLRDDKLRIITFLEGLIDMPEPSLVENGQSGFVACEKAISGVRKDDTNA